MTTSLCDLIRAHSAPQEPLPTDVEPVLRPLADVRAVLFDVYGTLLISASGDIGASDAATRAAATRDAFAAVTIPTMVPAVAAAAAMVLSIQELQEELRTKGIEYPEVDIVQVWRRTIDRLVAGELAPSLVEQIDVRQLALEYEVRANPVWPMPGLLECLGQLRGRRMLLGMVSNAQFFTAELFPALLGRTLEDLGFDPELCVFSYLYKRAKPDPWLFEKVGQRLAQRGIAAAQVLYVGNDRLNDIWPAARAGFHTALFAGDARSYRPRAADPRVADVRPDLVITHLSQLPQCLPQCLQAT